MDQRFQYKTETVKLLEEDIFDIGTGNRFLAKPPKAQATKTKINEGLR